MMSGKAGPWSLCVVTLLAAVVGAAASPSWRDSTATSRANREWCDPALGCLYITEEWYSLMRPINVLPFLRKGIDTRFMLHTRANRAKDEPVFVMVKDSLRLEATTFDPRKPIKFIIHGFIDTGNTYWLKDMAEALLDYGDYNVFRVNWGRGSMPMYSQAAANARVAGLEIGYLVNWFISEYGVNAGDVHLIGHSLGAHIAGYAGEQIKGLGRITGMDPAGPYYTTMPDVVRLNPKDALFIDNIHTDADSILFLGYGTGQPMGNIDFFPNSGHDQPGCDPVSIGINLITEADVGAVRDIAACSHCRAILLFIASLKERDCQFLAHECYDYGTFTSGNCGTCGDDNSKCAFMGIRADEYTANHRLGVPMYFDTDEREPFCYHHYEFAMLTSHPKKAEDWVVGHLTATLYSDNGLILEDVRISDKHRRIDHGTVNKFLFKSHVDLGTIMRADFRWDYDDQMLNPGTYCLSPFCNRNLYVRSVLISPISNYPESERLKHTRTFCERSGVEFVIKDGKSVSITSTSNCAPVE